MTSDRTPEETVERLARSLRLRLEDDGRAGRVAVPRPTPQVGRAPTDRRRPEPSEGERPARPSQQPEPKPEVRAADALRKELATAAQHTEGQDLFDFGSPDLEGGVGREDALKRIVDEVAQCTLCKELADSRTLTVPGQGDPNARLVFVGEGPGADEDRQGLAFVGRAGQLLTKMIESINLTRDQVFIANILKCRPPGNRTPAPDEIANCLPYLMRQLEILRPKILCALGGVAAQTLLQTRDGITRLRGRFHPYRGTLLMPTFHPAYLLRNYTKDARQKVYDDMLKIQAELKK
ncbi:MAG TPA: uracil-DNA glycosylase [Phycisphaerae bacterium]|nr:uracil-DNA glycosylase [Phycisphaerae bacterium]